MDVEAMNLCDMNVVGMSPNIEMDLDPSLRGRHTLGENDNSSGELVLPRLRLLAVYSRSRSRFRA